jgi:ProP effector
VKDQLHIHTDCERAQQLIAALAVRWPKCFAVAERRPLKLGIDRDLIAAGVAINEVQLALSQYVDATGYRRLLKAGAARVDLGGNPAGAVTAAEAATAAKVVAKRERQQRELERQQLEPRRLSLSDLRAAAQARKQAADR